MEEPAENIGTEKKNSMWTNSCIMLDHTFVETEEILYKSDIISECRSYWILFETSMDI